MSIIIVNWNTKDILHDCLKSIYEQAGEVDFEVIVIDNDSSDGSVGMVKKDFSQVRLTENPTNRGFAAANNQGIAIARGRYLLLLNSDTLILDRAIKKTVSFADDNPKAAVIGCRVLNPDKTLQPTCFMFPSILNMLLSSTYLYKLFPGSKFFGRERMTWWNRDDVRKVDVVTGCFMLVRREAIEQVGLLDESFFMYGEETDWCYRFKKAGWRVSFTSDAQIIHFGGASTDRMKPEMILQLRGSILQFMKKNRSSIEYISACLLLSLFFALRAPIWAAVALFSRQERRAARQRCRVYVRGAFYSLLGGSRLCLR